MTGPEATAIDAWIVVAPNAALRAEPSPEGAVLGPVAPGTRLTTTGEAVFVAGRLWRRVRRPEGGEGYIRDAFVVAVRYEA